LGLPAINFADGVVIPVDGHLAMQMRQGATVPLPVVAATAQVGSGMSVCLGVRPEHLLPATASGLVPLGDWSVIRSAPYGPAWLATVEQQGLVWQAWLKDEPKSGSLPLAARRDHVLVFDGIGVRIWPSVTI
jgi:hypothetical protein